MKKIDLKMTWINIKLWWYLKHWVKIKPSTLLILFTLAFFTCLYTPLKVYQYFQSQSPQYAKVLNTWENCQEIKYRTYCKNVVELDYANEIHYVKYYPDNVNYNRLALGEYYNFRLPFKFWASTEVSLSYIERPLLLEIADTFTSIMLLILIFVTILSPLLNDHFKDDLEKYLKEKTRCR